MSSHVVPVKIYFAVFGTLMIMTATTVAIAFQDLGPMNAVAALLIAAFKAVLVILYFMHVRYATRLTWIFVSAGFLWLALLISLTATDFLTRRWK